jgi:large subunit ribosomal protein L10
MENPRPEKVAVVDEVRGKFTDSEAVLITEYRGLTVRDLQELRSSLSAVGGEYKVYKNTLVRRATTELDLDLGEQLTGPTALAFVGTKADGTPGDAVLVAKALKSFSKANPTLVLKGGILGTHLLDEKALSELAEVAPREELLARLAGGMAAPMRNLASLMQAVPQKFAYALQALVEQGGAPGAPQAATEPADGPAADADGPADDSADTAAEAEADAPAPQDQDDTPATDAGDGATEDAEPAADDAAQEQE